MVPDLLSKLRKKAKAIGCVLVIDKKEGYQMATVSIIPDNKMSKKMLELGSVDGIFVWVNRKDMDKKAKHSNYYKELVVLDQRFDDVRDRLMKRAHVLNCTVEDVNSYYDALKKC